MILSVNLEKEIEGIVQEAMQAWNIPGLALVIVKDDSVFYIKGYGVREIGKPGLVDEHTLFGAASITKAFTAVGIGLLVQEGKLAWDDLVIKYLPTFRLHDSYATQLVTIRDLLCHRCGLGPDDGEALLYSNYPTEEVVRRLRHIPPKYSFRAGFGYSSLMYLTAGLITSVVSGMRWDDYIRQRIFDPLGMTDSVTNALYFRNYSNIAMPHEDIKGSIQVVNYRQNARFDAAASMCISASDIALWLRLQLNGGHIDGKQIVEPTVITETYTPHTPLRLTAVEKQLFPSRHFSAYGLGWFLSDLYGKFIVRHWGDVDGMLSNLVLIPEEKIGIAIFTNKKPNGAINAVPNFLIDTLLGVNPRDWIQVYIDLENEEQEKREQAQKQREKSRAKGSQPSLALEEYTGVYESAILGRAIIDVEREKIRIRLHAYESMSGTLTHWHYDTYLCVWDDRLLGESLISFISDGQGKIAEFRVKINENYLDSLEHIFKKRTAPGK